MNVVFIVPTGIGAEIGGHSGDATPAAKLIASVCDKLFIHPNVVNASDINEMTENMLYVEGSILDRFLEGSVGLREVRGNKMLLIANEITADIVNAVSAARATMGARIEIVELTTPLRMTATMHDGKAGGEIYGAKEAVRQAVGYDFDVLVVNTPIDIDTNVARDYLEKDGGVNPWGWVEAKLSKLMSDMLDTPVIHAPVESSSNPKIIVDARKSAEMVSVCYLHCCLKGGHIAPQISTDTVRALWVDDIDFLISPIGVWGRPHVACRSCGIPIIAVEENKTVLNEKMPDDTIIVKNYLEAAGVIAAARAGVSVESVRRPLEGTSVYRTAGEAM